MAHILVHKDSRTRPLKGDLLTDFRGDTAIFDSSEAPRHSGSTGRVYVREHRSSGTAGYYPSVFNLI